MTTPEKPSKSELQKGIEFGILMLVALALFFLGSGLDLDDLKVLSGFAALVFAVSSLMSFALHGRERHRERRLSEQEAKNRQPPTEGG